MRRLFWDIETSKGIYGIFGQGWNLRVGPGDEIVAPRIICICYKWEDEKKIHSIEWDKGDDRKVIRDFIKVLDTADESLGHNIDGFDLPWIRRRAIFYKIPMYWDYPTLDTLKGTKKNSGRGFRFDSNRLDAIARHLGIGKKIKTDIELWHDITYPAFLTGLFPITDKYYKALRKMVKYCKMDVEILEQVYYRLTPYIKQKTHAGVIAGGNKWDCPKCASGNIYSKETVVTAAGTKRKRLLCKDCGVTQTVAMKTFIDWQQFKVDLKLRNEQT